MSTRPTPRTPPVHAPLTPLWLLNDEPIGAFAADGLNMNEHARVIAEAVLGTQSPFTIGVFGAWGHGKTSLLNAARTMLEEPTSEDDPSLRHPHVITVHFNAWRYEREQHPIVPLLASIAKAIEARLDDPVLGQPTFTEKGKGFLKTVVKGCRAACGAIASIARGVNISAEVPFTGIKAELSVADALDSAKAAAAAPVNQAAAVAEAWIDRSLYFSAFDDLGKLHEAAKLDRANATHQAPVIAVFIDDLDRCRPENAVAVLEGIKLVLSQPGFVFVLALYREVIERYLEKESEKRFDKEHTRLGHGYIDKIVQLPLTLRSHGTEFAAFIGKIIDERVAPALLPVALDPVNPEHAKASKLVHALRGVIPLLTFTSQHSPRKLVRRINELLLDDRLCPRDAAASLQCDPEDVRATFLPLCLIQRSLTELPSPERIKPLIDDQPLCEALAGYREDLIDKLDEDGKSAPALFIAGLQAIEAASKELGPHGQKSADKPAPTDTDPALASIDGKKARRWLEKLAFVILQPRAAELLNTAAGRAWLRAPLGREVVRDFIATRPPAPADNPAPPAAGDASLQEQISLICTKIRRRLTLPADAPLGPAEFVRVTGLNFDGDPITDTGVAWLADPGTGMEGLTALWLMRTKVTDAGVENLARSDTGLKSLKELYLTDTQVTDAGVKDMAREDTGLKGLTKLSLGSTRVTDAGVKEVAREGTGLKGLTSLMLWNTQVTDAGVKELVRAQSGLKGLTELSLHDTQVTDAGVKHLAMKETGLGELISLNLNYTQVTDAGLRYLSKAETCLKRLTALGLGSTGVTDAGVKDLARAESGLRGLSSLDLSNTQVTDAGVKAVKKRWPGITVIM